MDEEKEEEEAETIQQAVNIQLGMPTQNIRGDEGGAALDHNKNVGEASQLGARRKVTNLGMIVN